MSRDFSSGNYLYNNGGAPADGVAPYTMCVWANADAMSSISVPLAMAKNTGTNFARLYVDTSGGLRFQTVGTGTSTVVHSGTLNTGQWYHYAGIQSSATSHWAYVDGSGTEGTTSSTTDNEQISVGVNRYGVSSTIYPFDGKIAWPAVWSVALSAEEIAALAAGAHPYSVRPSSLQWFVPLTGQNTGAEVDLIGGTSLTEVGTVGSAESPMLACGGPMVVTRSAAAAAGDQFRSRTFSALGTRMGSRQAA